MAAGLVVCGIYAVVIVGRAEASRASERALHYRNAVTSAELRQLRDFCAEVVLGSVEDLRNHRWAVGTRGTEVFVSRVDAPSVQTVLGTYPIKPTDAWGNPFRLVVDANGVKGYVYSCGANGADEGGGADDIKAVFEDPAKGRQ